MESTSTYPAASALHQRVLSHLVMMAKVDRYYAWSAGGVDFTNLTGVVFDAAQGIPPVNPAGCGSPFGAGCRTVFTNLASDHLDYHHTREAYFEAKAKLFAGLSSEATAVITWGPLMGRRLPPPARWKWM